jgi:pimeloyl-ACP methyl ester carboxylesterase
MGRRHPRGRAAAGVTSHASSQPPAASESTGRAQLANGNELHFVEAGRGPAVIFMHGGMGDCRSWQPQLSEFAHDFRPVAYSRRLHSPNRNPMPLVHPSLDDEAVDLYDLQQALRTGPAHLVATSYGALVALAFALRHPLRVRSLVLVEPPLHHWAGATLRGSRLLRQFMGRCWRPARCAFDEGNDEQALRLLTDGMWGRPIYDSIAANRRAAALHNAAAMKVLVGAANLLPDLSRDAVGKLPMPVLLVQGAWASGLHRHGLDELAAVLPNALRVVIESAGHASPSENPLSFNAAVLEFFLAHRGCETV